MLVDSQARADPAGVVVIRSGGGSGGSILYEAYVSPATGQRVVVHLRPRPWVDAPLVPVARVPEGTRAVIYRLWIYRRTAEGTELVGAPVLGSVVGRVASYSFGFVLDDPAGGAGTREDHQVRVRGVDLRDDALVGTAALSGAIRGRRVEGTIGWALASGEEAMLSIDLGEFAHEDLGFQVILVASF